MKTAIDNAIDKFTKMQEEAPTMRDRIYLDGVLTVLEGCKSEASQSPVSEVSRETVEKKKPLSEIEESLIKVLQSISIFDLSDCIFRYDTSDDTHWVNAENEHGRVIDAIEYDGNIFKVIGDYMEGEMKIYNPQIEAISMFASLSSKGEEASIDHVKEANQIARDIFYSQATNGKAEGNIQLGAEKILAFAKSYKGEEAEPISPSRENDQWDWYGWLCARIPVLKESANKFWIHQCVNELLAEPKQDYNQLKEAFDKLESVFMQYINQRTVYVTDQRHREKTIKIWREKAGLPPKQ